MADGPTGGPTGGPVKSCQARREQHERYPISDLLERLRERHWRVTPQRRVVAEVLDGEHVHLTAEAILTRALERLPEISLATVYNTLNELVAMGEVIEVPAGGGPKRYDPNVTKPHHHLVCTSCGLLRDVPARMVEPLSFEERFGFEVGGVEVVFRGLCPSCASGHPVDGNETAGALYGTAPGGNGAGPMNGATASDWGPPGSDRAGQP